jgi:DNA repair protein RecO (recombination protein O)
MESFEDTGIVLSARAYEENAAILHVLTQEHGRYAGFVHGGRSSKKRALLEPGTILNLNWRARTAEQLGAFDLELEHATHARLMDDAGPLRCLIAACAVMDAAVPERAPMPQLYAGTQAMMEALEGPAWAESYVIWELGFLSEMGFALELDRCAGGGASDDLAYVSPKSGRAVSREKGAPYADKLFTMPDFLKPGAQGGGDAAQIAQALAINLHFIENRLFAHTSREVPAARTALEAFFEGQAA